MPSPSKPKLLTWASRSRVFPVIPVWASATERPYYKSVISFKSFLEDAGNHHAWETFVKDRFSVIRPIVKPASQITGEEAFKLGCNIEWPLIALCKSIGVLP